MARKGNSLRDQIITTLQMFGPHTARELKVLLQKDPRNYLQNRAMRPAGVYKKEYVLQDGHSVPVYAWSEEHIEDAEPVEAIVLVERHVEELFKRHEKLSLSDVMASNRDLPARITHDVLRSCRDWHVGDWVKGLDSPVYVRGPGKSVQYKRQRQTVPLITRIKEYMKDGKPRKASEIAEAVRSKSYAVSTVLRNNSESSFWRVDGMWSMTKPDRKIEALLAQTKSVWEHNLVLFFQQRGSYAGEDIQDEGVQD